jgi:RNA polymerase sigma-70 factor, ECF subfamily
MDSSIDSNASSAEERASSGVDGGIDDAEWCRQIAGKIGSGDPSAEAVLLDRLRPGLEMVLIARCFYDKELAADLCQDTLVIVLQRLRNRSMEDPSRLAAFAAQTARQLAFDSRRRYALRNTVTDSEAIERAQIEAPADDSMEKESTTSLVRQLLAEFSHDRDREILRRFYLLEHDKTDICRQFGLAPGTFDQVVFRARARLRAMLEARGVGSRDLMCVLIIWVPKSWRR